MPYRKHRTLCSGELPLIFSLYPVDLDSFRQTFGIVVRTVIAAFFAVYST